MSDSDSERIAQQEITPLSEQKPRASAYRRTTPHLTQAPISDTPDPEYATINRYETLDQRVSYRRHAGVASSDPDYLPKTEFQLHQERAAAARARAHETAIDRTLPQTNTAERKTHNLHYERYLQTPKSKKSIFGGQALRKRRMRTVLVMLLIVAIALVLIWLLLLR